MGTKKPKTMVEGFGQGPGCRGRRHHMDNNKDRGFLLSPFHQVNEGLVLSGVGVYDVCAYMCMYICFCT